MTIISLTVSCSLRAHQLCRKEKGNTKAARPSIVSSSSTQKSHTVSPKYVFYNSTNPFSTWQQGCPGRHLVRKCKGPLCSASCHPAQGTCMWVMHLPWQDNC